MEKLCASKTFFEMAGGGMHTLVLPPGSAPGHQLQKPSKDSGIFQSLGTISFFFILFKGRVKREGGGAWHKDNRFI